MIAGKSSPTLAAISEQVADPVLSPFSDKIGFVNVSEPDPNATTERNRRDFRP